jgi:aspartate 1-decarboxylase
VGFIRLMRAKLHHVRVTHCRRDYVGSIAVDAALLDQVGLLPLEEVDVVDITNGNRWSTYVLPAERGSGLVCPNGGGALLCTPGDQLIVFAYESRTRASLATSGHTARILVADQHNACASLFEQSLAPGASGLTYRTRVRIGAALDQPHLQEDDEHHFATERAP